MHDKTVYFSGLLRFPLKKCVGVPSSAAAEGEEAAAAAPDVGRVQPQLHRVEAKTTVPSLAVEGV